ncbi:MAG: sulfurtransferase [Candidatus Zixiibacteriota bacterium]
MSMYYRPIVFLMLLVSLTLLTSIGLSQSQSSSAASDNMGTLVSTGWLSQHLNDPNLVVLDCTVLMKPGEKGGMRAESGRAEYEKSHIPSAGFADLLGDLRDVNSPMGFALPTPEQFCAAMGALGVGNDSRVVLYDGFNSVWAARVWWMLRWVGFDNAAILDGGMAAWTAEKRPVSAEPVSVKPKQLTPHVRPQVIAYKDEVFKAINDKKVHLVDAMMEPHYRGEMALYGRPGHIPGAVNVSALGLLDTSMHYKPKDELGAMFTFDKKERAITYCGAGVAASSVAFAMYRLGYTDVAVYMASLQEWAADPANPLVVD